MPTKMLDQFKLDARPDRVDLRDREYRPPLQSVPEKHPDPKFIEKYLPQYTKDLILDQGSEGACTGFGLAAVVNYLLWRKAIHEEPNKAAQVESVSPRMLYHMARIYDEWPEEDYEGSSCRGAMKGWHHHGVCREKLWPYRDRNEQAFFVPPKKGWQEDAATRPLGAYYRIDRDSLNDLQSAVFEVGAIYVSAAVHRGWLLKKSKTLPVIKEVSGETGGHAFAIVGYDPEGFIVQNSWGRDWGYNGFAVLTYADWFGHATDAWVAVLGAPVQLPKELRSARSFSVLQLHEAATAGSQRSSGPSAMGGEVAKAAPGLPPCVESQAYEHTVVLANDGVPVNRLLDVANAQEAVQQVVYKLPLDWMRSWDAARIAIFAHGGLNDEKSSIRRVQGMAPYFLENGVYPLFLTWRTGFMESLQGIIEDALAKSLPLPPEGLARGFFDAVLEWSQEKIDRAIEVAAENLIVKAVWSQMKLNARAAAAEGQGLHLLADQLKVLKREVAGLDIHLVGHSAGAILLGYLLDLLSERKLTVQGCRLYAPACTLRFALDHYKPAIERGTIAAGNGEPLNLDILSDERERDDAVGPYRKSLLYLVSRALEEVHKMPLLGLETALDARVEPKDAWNRHRRADLEGWRKFARKLPAPKVYRDTPIWDGVERIPLVHGSFDNNITVVTSTLEQIVGSSLRAPVTNLHGF